MLLQIALLCAIGCMKGHSVGAIECYTCTNSSSIPACTSIVQCSIDSACSSEYNTVQGTRFYTLGCRNTLSCPISSTVSSTSSIVGRRTAGANTNCSECCHSNHCNRQHCQDTDQNCADDKNYSCANVGSVVDICAEGSHIKPYCKRFCGFCDTVDGEWSRWSEWGNCDVTCGNGTRTKSRTCTDPPPANGGSDCVGEKQAHELCSKDFCPVHGGWSQWSQWGACSVTCDVGLQRRVRTCSDPFPAYNGDQCYGDSGADGMCFPGACANGSWSSWSSWGHCTKTCDGGVKTRTRDCDHPAPSMTGRYCSGQPTEADSCNVSPCQGSTPSHHGSVVFFAKELPGGSSPTLAVNAPLRFTNVITNVGHGYDNSTGFFTAPVNGTYSFNVQFCPYTKHYAEVGLVVNGVPVTTMQGYSADLSSCRTLSVPVILKQGDKVQARIEADSNSPPLFQDSYRANTFSGILIQ